MFHALEAADDPAELHAFLGEGDGGIEHVLGGAQRVGGEHDAAGVQHAPRGGHRRVGGVQTFRRRTVKRYIHNRACPVDAALHSCATRRASAATTAAWPSGR